MTYTYALLGVSRAAFDEIKAKLEAAGYEDQFHDHDEGVVIDMHGIALVTAKQPAERDPSRSFIELERGHLARPLPIWRQFYVSRRFPFVHRRFMRHETERRGPLYQIGFTSVGDRVLLWIATGKDVTAGGPRDFPDRNAWEITRDHLAEMLAACEPGQRPS